MERPSVRTREEFLRFLFELLDFIDAVEPENSTLDMYIRAAASWLHDEQDAFCRSLGESRDLERAEWQVFADLLSEALAHDRRNGADAPGS